jgi:hypothetical protein
MNVPLLLESEGKRIEAIDSLERLSRGTANPELADENECAAF